MHIMSKKFVFIIQNMVQTYGWTVFLVSKVRTLYHYVRMTSLFDDLPFDVKVDVFVYF